MPLLLFAVSAVLTLIPFAPRAQNAADPGMVAALSWLRSHLDDKSVVVITTGNRAVYDRGHIPGARFVSHDDTIRMSGNAHYLLDPAALAAALSKVGARDDARIVLYGDSAMSTGWLYMALASVGHGPQVSILDGNIDAWRAGGHPVSTDLPQPATGQLTAGPAPGIIVDAPWVKAHLDDTATRVIDSRTQGEWDAGHLPKATLVLWQDLFSDIKLLTFKPKDQVRALFKQAGVGDSSQVVTYCAVGMRASLMYFAARYAGIPAQVYVGSFEDWKRQSGYPIEK
jgi:thiosulfate/3-mercaptopyruvate sulfurtransferase